MTFETLITFLTIENNNFSIHRDPSIKTDKGKHWQFLWHFEQIFCRLTNFRMLHIWPGLEILSLSMSKGRVTEKKRKKFGLLLPSETPPLPGLTKYQTFYGFFSRHPSLIYVYALEYRFVHLFQHKASLVHGFPLQFLMWKGT